MQIIKYPQISGVSIELDNNSVIDDYSYKYMRIGVPSELGIKKHLIENDFILVDRTIKVKVPIQKNDKDFYKLIRTEVVKVNDEKNSIRNIAYTSFVNDFRFQIDFHNYSDMVYKSVIDSWIDKQEEVYVCRYNGEVVGFADIRILEESKGCPFIFLAAVDKAYRTAGIAMSLYATVFKESKELGYKFVFGRVSSKNMAVINLYNSFNAIYSEPLDIYIKR